MLHETKDFDIMDTIFAIRKVTEDLAKGRLLMKSKVDKNVMDDIETDANKRGTKKHFFNKQYKVRV